MHSCFGRAEQPGRYFGRRVIARGTHPGRVVRERGLHGLEVGCETRWIAARGAEAPQLKPPLAGVERAEAGLRRRECSRQRTDDGERAGEAFGGECFRHCGLVGSGWRAKRGDGQRGETGFNSLGPSNCFFRLLGIPDGVGVSVFSQILHESCSRCKRTVRILD